MSLKDGLIKMSKSDPSDLSRINLTDDKDLISNKIKKAKTDNSLMPSDNSNLEKRPEVENLLGIYSSLNNQNLEKSIEEFSGKNFSDFKQKLSEVVVEKISPISSEINKLLKVKRPLNMLMDVSKFEKKFNTKLPSIKLEIKNEVKNYL